MDIIPAIDLQNNQCVRLKQGDFTDTKVYNPDPLQQAQSFAAANATWLHVVDLDGARDGTPHHTNLIARLVKETPLNIQTGGGIRDAQTVETLLACGVKRVVIGSLAVKNPPLVRDWLRRFGPQSIVLAVDIKDIDGTPVLLTQGWQNNSNQSLWNVLDSFADSGLQNILCTDVSRDGMLGGVNVALYTALAKRAPQLRVQASGGVSTLDDLATLSGIGTASVIVGKALYENRFTLQAAMQQVQNAG